MCNYKLYSNVGLAMLIGLPFGDCIGCTVLVLIVLTNLHLKQRTYLHHSSELCPLFSLYSYWSH